MTTTTVEPAPKPATASSIHPAPSVAARTAANRPLRGRRELLVRAVDPKEGDPKERTYALATETFVRQDSSVLIATGMRLRGGRLPALRDHRTSQVVGEWTKVRAHGDEVHADIRWADLPEAGDEHKDLVSTTRALAENGFLMNSISFAVVKWHAPDELERAKYGIPEDDPWAGVIDEWEAYEASFVAVPADPNSGPRSLRLAVERGVITEDQRERFERDAELGAVKGLLEQISLRLDITDARLQSALDLALSTRAVPPAREPAPAKSPANAGRQDESTRPAGDAAGTLPKRELYDRERLGQEIAAIRAKLPVA